MHLSAIKTIYANLHDRTIVKEFVKVLLERQRNGQYPSGDFLVPTERRIINFCRVLYRIY